MVKNLRSFIHEKFSLDLRVDLDILSRRRDIVNEEKQDELLKLLRKYEIKDIVQLGPGTNRYAIKLDGFVVKFATDHDGKIDNLKEFKMAKRLFPYVTKCYEVSKNGTILIAEYIQPFDSYSEMCTYANRIREILTKIAKVYLIGDVGITSVNYVNWGIRPGTDDPVCLDFAYVYEVKSELFICKYCKANAMMVPNKDFTELYCSNPGCKRKYTFEDIRARIGNDIHRHEIGDLSEEGYVMDQSNIITELSVERSNYLRKKEPEKEQKVEEKEEKKVFDFEMEKPPNEYIKEEREMKSGMVSNANAVAVSVIRRGKENNPSSSKPIIVNARARVVKSDPEPEREDEVVAEEVQEEVAFSGTIVNHPESIIDQTDPDEEDEATEIEDDEDIDASDLYADSDEVVEDPEPTEEIHEEVQEEVVVEQDTEDHEEEKPEVAVKVTNVKVVEKKEQKQPQKPVQQKQQHDKKPNKPQVNKNQLFSNNFMNNSYRALSKISNMIGTYLHIIDGFSVIKPYISSNGKGQKKIYPEECYKNIQNAVFNSLASFCCFTEGEIETSNGKKKVLQPPKFENGQIYNPTLKFIDRIWSDREISGIEDPNELLKKYKEKYDDYLGIQVEWIEYFKNRMIEKKAVTKNGADVVVSLILKDWVAEDKPDVEPEQVDEVVEDHEPTEEIHEEVQEEVVVQDTEDHEETIDDSDTVVLSGEIQQDSEEDEDDEPIYITVLVTHDSKTGLDIIQVTSQEEFGVINIPFYVDLNSVDITKDKYVTDERNGIMDWLTCFIPDMTFYTDKPEYWLQVNEGEVTEDKMYAAIIDENSGHYIVGLYRLNGVFEVENGEYELITDLGLLEKIYYVISNNIGWTAISHIERTVLMKEDILTEEYIQMMVRVAESSDEDDGEEIEDTDDSEELTPQEKAAVAAVIGEMANMTEDHEEDVVEDKPETTTTNQNNGTLHVVRRKKQ